VSRRLLLVSCGGTITAGPAPGGATTTGSLPGPVTPLADADDLAQGLALPPGTALETATYSTVPSSDLTIDDVVALRRLLVDWVGPGDDPEACVVVAQGTDTMEETSWALDLIWGLEVPVVVTGAMRHPGSAGADGAVNLAAAAVTACSAGSRGQGVLVVANDEVHLAAAVRKGHTRSPAAFASPTVGAIGWVADGEARLPRRRAHRPAPLDPGVPLAGVPVASLSAGIGDDGRLLTGVLDAGCAGAVIEGMGGGHLPGAMVATPAFTRLVDTMPVVVSSRVPDGELLSGTYRFCGAETDLRQRGTLTAGVLSTAKARVLLALALASTVDRAGAERAFAERSLAW
jgi:L-asparaginase